MNMTTQNQLKDRRHCPWINTGANTPWYTPMKILARLPSTTGPLLTTPWTNKNANGSHLQLGLTKTIMTNCTLKKYQFAI